MRWLIALAFAACCCDAQIADKYSNARPPRDDGDLRFWLENMIWHHRFTTEEVSLATGLSPDAVRKAQQKWAITSENRPAIAKTGKVRMLPYPGGRHPRIGFLEGAVNPQRETKISVFTPWDENSYVVIDLPEAIWCQYGLLYLAHTHVPTMWTKQGVTLEPLEWKGTSGPAGETRLQGERKLPNGVTFGAIAEWMPNAVRMELWLKNGSNETLRDLRVQNCVMLKGAAGFEQQTNANKIFQPPFVACGSPDRKRWVITAWMPIHRAWGNPPVPCLHSDPKFPDCSPGQTQRLHGWLWFYEGMSITNELQRLESL
jgi:hypothetical protein